MNQDELIRKLVQIEEQAQLTLEEFPKSLTKERQRMIIALARYIRTDVSKRMEEAAGELADRVHAAGHALRHEGE
jgi:hypothetical protein